MRTPIFMNDPKYDEIVERIRKSYPDSCVLFIDEINNTRLLENYQEQYAQIVEKRGPEKVKERLLFHGTRAECIEPIIQNGFDPMCNSVSAFGVGTYFAKEAKLSYQYMKNPDPRGISYMILAKVLVGSIGKVYGNGALIDTNIHDNSVNYLTNPSIIVTPYASGAYPQYVIGIYKNATNS